MGRFDRLDAEMRDDRREFDVLLAAMPKDVDHEERVDEIMECEGALEL